MKISVLFLSFICTAFYGVAQDLQITLRDQDKSLEEMAARKVVDTSGFKNLPYKNSTHFSLRKVAYNEIQAMFERVLNKTTQLSEYRRLVKMYDYDTIHVAKTKMPKNVFYIATSIDTLGIKHVIVDANNNRDFGDDKEYLFDPKNRTAIVPEIDVKINYFDLGLIKEGTAKIKLDGYQGNLHESAYKSEMDYNLDVSLSKIFHDKVGQIKLDNKVYNIKTSFHERLYSDSKFTIAVSQPHQSGSVIRYTYSSKDSLDLGYKKYRVTSLVNNVLSLKFVKNNVFSGASVNTLAPPIKELDFVTKKVFSLNAQKGKYIILDFWGSWCGPCIKLLPELKRVYEQYKDKVTFVSVAYDQEKNKDKLLKLINEHGMVWSNVFDDRDPGKSAISKNYKVQEYPTTILIDPKGYVVLRSVAAKGLQDLIDYLNKTTLKKEGR